MSKVFFTSDLHFGHKKLCENVRGMTMEESNEYIVKQWNSVVSKRDIVYVLGDIVREDSSYLHWLDKLNGTIYVVGGNHDDRKVCKKLRELGITVLGCLKYRGFICTHIPVHPSELREHRANIHGHLHRLYYGKESNIHELGILYYNVNCEHHDYKPVNIEDIIKYYDCVESEGDLGGVSGV